MQDHRQIALCRERVGSTRRGRRGGAARAGGRGGARAGTPIYRGSLGYATVLARVLVYSGKRWHIAL